MGGPAAAAVPALTVPPLPFGLEQVGDALGGEGDGEEDEEKKRCRQPRFAVGEADEEHRRDHQPDPAEGRRGERPHRLLALSVRPGRSRLAARRATWIPRWASHAAAATAKPSSGQSGKHENRERGG